MRCAGSGFQEGDGHGQAEAPRTGAAGVDELHLIPFRDNGPVRVSGHDDTETCGPGVEVHLLQIMENVDSDTFQLEREMKRDFGGPRAFVVVSPDRIDWRYRTQLLQNLGSADVASMDDVLNTRERADCLRPKQSMRIRDDAYGFQKRAPDACGLTDRRPP